MFLSRFRPSSSHSSEEEGEDDDGKRPRCSNFFFLSFGVIFRLMQRGGMLWGKNGERHFFLFFSCENFALKAHLSPKEEGGHGKENLRMKEKEKIKGRLFSSFGLSPPPRSSFLNKNRFGKKKKSFLLFSVSGDDIWQK